MLRACSKTAPCIRSDRPALSLWREASRLGSVSELSMLALMSASELGLSMSESESALVLVREVSGILEATPFW